MVFQIGSSTFVTNPVSNLKLAVGRVFPLAAARAHGIPVGLGTDGAASNNGLDLLQDVPAGKLAIAELAVSGRDEVAELERAGMDAVIVPGGNVAELVGGNHFDV